MLRYIFYAQVQFPPDFLVMILNAKNSNIILWANLPDYAKKNRLRYTLRYSFILSEAPGPLRYKFYAPVQFFTHFLVMILNAKNSKIIFWAYKPYYAKKTRSGTAPVQNYDNQNHHNHHNHGIIMIIATTCQGYLVPERGSC